MEVKNVRQDNHHPSGLFSGKVVSGRPGHSEKSHLIHCDPLPCVTKFTLKHHSGNISSSAAPQGMQPPRSQCSNVPHYCQPPHSATPKAFAFVQSQNSFLEQPQSCLPFRQGGLTSGNRVSVVHLQDSNLPVFGRKSIRVDRITTTAITTYIAFMCVPVLLLAHFISKQHFTEKEIEAQRGYMTA